MDPEDLSIQFLREITDDFAEERKLGEGAFGIVYKGVTKNGKDVAVKMMKIRDANLDYRQFQNEFYSLRKLKHHNIVEVLGYCYETEKKHFTMPDGSEVLVDKLYTALCFEYFHNGSLKNHLSEESKGLDWHERFKIIKGICEGINYIHEGLKEPIYHLDLKPDNILLDKDMVPKIADFGMARIFGKELSRTTQNPYGTHVYQPPEYIDKGEISRKFDIFSLGVIIIRIMCGYDAYPKCLYMSSDVFIDQVRENWRNRLQETCSSDSSLEVYCHQIKTCTQIALNCVEKDSHKRHEIVKIIEKLNEIQIDIGKPPHNRCYSSIPKMAMHTKEEVMGKKPKDITNQHQNIKLMGGTGRNELEFVDVRKTSSVVVEEFIVGRKEAKEQVMNCLLKGISKKLTILPIYGMGGIGKTTLARLIYNDQQFIKYYSRIWVYVSQRFNLENIRESIVSQLCVKGSKNNEINTADSSLARLLYGKKILIVLDDMWEDNQFQLNQLTDMLNQDGSNIIILVTTRSELVAERICTYLQPYKMLLLKDHECWDIIKQISGFEARDDKEQLVGLGMEIAQKCGGVALAAASLGFTLKSMNFNKWMEVKDSEIWGEPVSKDASSQNDVLSSLKLSYIYMDPCLKLCFTHCAVFPKGHKIVKNDLIYQWISLGFIKPTKLLSKMQLCEKYIVQLLGLSFFQHSVSSKTIGMPHEDVTVFTMHDLVHDLAELVMVDEILDASKQGNTGGKTIHFELLSDFTESLEPFTQSDTEIRGLRFVESDNSGLHGESSPSSKFLCFRVYGEIGFYDDVFLSAKYLRVLDLSECLIHELPNSICNLMQLRYLNAPRIQHRDIPICITKISKLIYLSLRESSATIALQESIGEMEDFMYLDLSGCSGLGKLPVSFGKLKKLVHLDLSNCYKVTGVSESLESLTNLEHLNLSSCCNIGELPQHLGSLLKLRSLDLSNSSYVGDDVCIDARALVTLTKLEYLNLASERSCIKNLHAALSRLTNLKYLDLSGVQRHCFSQRRRVDIPATVHGALDTIYSLTKLQYLKLSDSDCFFVDAKLHAELSEAMGNLTELRYLDLSNCPLGVDHEDYYIFLECISKLPSLEHLDLSYNLASLTSIPDSFRNLRELHTLDLAGCWDLESLPENLDKMTKLKYLILTDCNSLNTVPQPNRSLVTLPKFVVQADCHDSTSNLALLQDANCADLVISSLENVKSVEEARSIKLAQKSRMARLELNWTEDVERTVEDTELLAELEPPSTLQELRIDGYNSAGFPDWFDNGIATHLPNLVHISMSNLPKCKNLPPLGQLPFLRELVLRRMNGITKIDWDMCGRRPLYTLMKFVLCEMESLLVWYTTNSCGGDDGVPEFMFPSLHDLEVSDCPKLRLKPCPHEAKDWVICGSSDAVMSSCGDGACSPSSARVTTLRVTGCKVPMHQWRLLHHLHGLTKLHIKECSDLSSSPEVIRALSSLELLYLNHNHQPEVPNWLGQLASLKELIVSRYEVKALQEAFPHLTWLHSLHLDDFASMTALPQSLGDLISLGRLEIENCPGLNDLPESIGRLTSLRSLEIRSCEGIKSLPESIQQLTKLEYFYTSDCKALDKWCKSEENKRKLAHIKAKIINRATWN